MDIKQILKDHAAYLAGKPDGIYANLEGDKNKCPYCGAEPSFFYPHLGWTCGTEKDALHKQSILCSEREVNIEIGDVITKISEALGLKTFLDDNPCKGYPELGEAMMEKIRDLVWCKTSQEHGDSE